VDSLALAQNRIVIREPKADGAQSIVSCGHSNLNNIVIVDPDRRIRCPEETVGEIWASGGSIAKGYWNQPEATKETFQAYIDHADEGPFLRTGDLGFIKDGSCFVTGRLKDLLIIRGYNFYPQDIELTVEKSHPALRANCTAAFSIEANGRECLAIVQEVERTYLRKLDLNEVTAAIYQAVAEKHELQLHALVLIRPGSIPKTSSGKIQRRVCKARFLERSFEVVGEWRREDAFAAVKSIPAEPSPKSAEVIRAWLVRALSRQVNLPEEALDEYAPFSRHGLDSFGAVQLATALEQWLGRRFSPTLLYDFPTIAVLASHLASESAVQVSGGRTRSLGREPIAVVGMSCRFPGAGKPEAFWELLHTGGDDVSELVFPRFELRDLASDSEGRDRWRLRICSRPPVRNFSEFHRELEKWILSNACCWRWLGGPRMRQSLRQT
jgi:acyl carrier protein